METIDSRGAGLAWKEGICLPETATAHCGKRAPGYAKQGGRGARQIKSCRVHTRDGGPFSYCSECRKSL